MHWAKRSGRPAALILLELALLWQQADPGHFLERTRIQVFKLYQRLHPRPRPQPSPVVVVDVDEASLAALGPWPWPQGAILTLVDNLSQAGAGEVTFDLGQADEPVFLYAGPYDPAAYIPARDVVDGTFDPERVAGRIVLVGSSAPGLGQIRSTAIDRRVPAVEVHAQAIEMARDGMTLSIPRLAGLVESCAAVTGGLLLMVLAPLVAGWRAAAFVGLGAALTAGSWWRFVTARDLYDPLFPTLALGLILAGLALGRHYAGHHQGGEGQDGGAVQQPAPGA